MQALKSLSRCLVAVLMLSASCVLVCAQKARRGEEEFGPNVRIYLEYLRAEQEVVDDRGSRHEIDRRYYLHNSNRIRALRQMAIRIARESGNDYLPEMEAVSEDEFNQLFEPPLPEPSAMRVGETLAFKFRYLGALVVNREKFHLFARLDPYEQAELRKSQEAKAQAGAHANTPTPPEPQSRPRKVNAP